MLCLMHSSVTLLLSIDYRLHCTGLIAAKWSNQHCMLTLPSYMHAPFFASGKIADLGGYHEQEILYHDQRTDEHHLILCQLCML